MKKSARRILTLVLTLVLICALAVIAFAEEPIVSESVNYSQAGGEFIMTHTLRGYDTRAVAVISYSYYDGTPAPDNYWFTYDGYIDYQYCPEDQIRPSSFVSARKTASGIGTGPSVTISTNTLSSGYMMVDASMRFTTQFRYGGFTITHTNPTTIYIGIY